jgi:DNA-binding MarR family transcriptional regulator
MTESIVPPEIAVAPGAWLAALKASRERARYLDGVLSAAHAMSVTGYLALRELSVAHGGKLSRSRLSATLGLSMPLMWLVLRDLEQQGYTTRAVDRVDARLALAAITDAGRDALAAAGRTLAEGLQRPVERPAAGIVRRRPRASHPVRARSASQAST